jgi:transposase
MKRWTTKEAKAVLEWACATNGDRRSLEALSEELRRSPAAIKQFMRREFPEDVRPWPKRRRWQSEEVEVILNGTERAPAALGRTREAVRKYVKRNGLRPKKQAKERLDGGYTVEQVAEDFGRSRRTVYRWISRGILRRFHGSIAESSYEEIIKNRPELIAYSQLSREQKEWLIVNGYRDQSIQVNRPSVKGLLKG